MVGCKYGSLEELDAGVMLMHVKSIYRERILRERDSNLSVFLYKLSRLR